MVGWRDRLFTWSLDSMSAMDIDATEAACFSAQTKTIAKQSKRRTCRERNAMMEVWGGNVEGGCEVDVEEDQANLVTASTSSPEILAWKSSWRITSLIFFFPFFSFLSLITASFPCHFPVIFLSFSFTFALFIHLYLAKQCSKGVLRSRRVFGRQSSNFGFLGRLQWAVALWCSKGSLSF